LRTSLESQSADKASLSRAQASRGLIAIFGSTMFEMSGVMMLSPLLILLLKQAGVSTTVAGLFAACSWLGILLVTPFASMITQALGRRRCLWIATLLPLLTSIGFLLTDNLAVWFALKLIASVAGGLRWVLAEAFIAELAPPEQMGRYVGMYASLMGLTFVIGPAVLAWVGTTDHTAFWIVIGLLAAGAAMTPLVPAIQPAADLHTSLVGFKGLWHALSLHPLIMLAGFVGGFFELGLSSILPLVGLNLNLDARASALLVAVSGLGVILLAIPSGMLADRFADPERGRRFFMGILAFALLVSAILVFALPDFPELVWPMALIWGGAGGTLYTLTMTDIAAREKGITLVNSTAVLVLSYTLGALAASSTSGALLDWSPAIAFPVVLVAVALTGLLAIIWPTRR
jgi:MFS family permease